MKKLRIIKIGGNVIDNQGRLERFLSDFVKVKGPKILVHGGGKIASEMATKLGIEAKLIEGRRVTDSETIKVVTMVYAGLVNKNIVAKLQALNCNALGLSGADGNAIKAHKRPVKEIDFGWVGDLAPDAINVHLIEQLLESGFLPVFSAITHDGKGHLLNTNADTIASALAVALSKNYACSLIYCFEKKGVLKDVFDEDSVIRKINCHQFPELKETGVISQGMIPKIQNSFDAINQGVSEVLIGSSEELALLNQDAFGTKLI